MVLKIIESFFGYLTVLVFKTMHSSQTCLLPFLSKYIEIEQSKPNGLNWIQQTEIDQIRSNGPKLN